MTIAKEEGIMQRVRLAPPICVVPTEMSVWL